MNVIENNDNNNDNNDNDNDNDNDNNNEKTSWIILSAQGLGMS